MAVAQRLLALRGRTEPAAGLFANIFNDCAVSAITRALPSLSLSSMTGDFPSGWTWRSSGEPAF
jgi:hypothetical protein